MKAITWLASVSVGIAVLAPSTLASATVGWVTEIEEAFDLAKAEKKAVLLSFVGSDWCPPCIAMERNVFSKPEFVQKASEKYVLVQVDLPRGDEAIREKNQPHAQKYRIDGFPTIVLLEADGQEFGRFFAGKFPSVEEMLRALDRSLTRKDFD